MSNAQLSGCDDSGHVALKQLNCVPSLLSELFERTCEIVHLPDNPFAIDTTQFALIDDAFAKSVALGAHVHALRSVMQCSSQSFDIESMAAQLEELCDAHFVELQFALSGKRLTRPIEPIVK